MSSRPQPKCPIRIGEPCSLCFPGADGPQNCGLVYLVGSDPELRDQLAAAREERRVSTAAWLRRAPMARASGSGERSPTALSTTTAETLASWP